MVVAAFTEVGALGDDVLGLVVVTPDADRGLLDQVAGVVDRLLVGGQVARLQRSVGFAELRVRL